MVFILAPTEIHNNGPKCKMVSILPPTEIHDNGPKYKMVFILGLVGALDK